MLPAMSQEYESMELNPALQKEKAELCHTIENCLNANFAQVTENLAWLRQNMHPYFFITMKEETEAIIGMANALHSVARQRKIVLSDTDNKLILARRDVPGSIYETMKTLQEVDISYAEMGHSYAPLPDCSCELEFQKYEFERKSRREIAEISIVDLPRGISNAILDTIKVNHPDFNLEEFNEILRLLWINNESYVRISPPERTARILWLFQRCRMHDGLFMDVEKAANLSKYKESRLLFSIKNPPQKAFMPQISEIFQRLDIGVRRSYCLNISTSMHTYFLGTYYIRPRSGELLEKDSSLYGRLKNELYNTQILPTTNTIYKNFVVNSFMTGEEASLANAFIAFVHTFLAHSHPDRFSCETVKSAFEADPGMVLKLIDLFTRRFDPDADNREAAYLEAIEDVSAEIQSYTTGQQYLDDIRKTIFQTCLIFIRNVQKTNYFVPEKHALAFRLDPACLQEVGPDFTADLPDAVPFRITFFYGRYGVGYHIGFSDIARGGWRSIICRNRDEYFSNTNTLFKEVFVLAHTQHLKNKDIYEGGSKMALVMDAVDLDSEEEITQRLYKIQFGITNAFLDIFVTDNGTARHPRVVDYYNEEEPIEVGPDENMHDSMIELIVQQAEKRGYLLGIGIMSSKQVGINHKEYGVTSRGVVTFAEIAMHEIGLDIRRDAFSVRFTGGTNGDVAGNSINLLLQRCPRVKIKSLVDGTAGLYDPDGADTGGLAEIVLKKDLDGFDPEKLHTGGFILYRNQRKQDGVRQLYRKVTQTETGLQEDWLTVDELYRAMNHLTFSVTTDLFLPCGGRPETINEKTWKHLFSEDGKPSARIIVEGANSFITPKARRKIQKKGVVVLRDASANKCGVISSSYEIIANLLMAKREFMTHKEAYVKDVIEILEKRAGDEARLIFRRHKEAGGRMLHTDISTAISEEINDHYGQLFDFFQSRPDLAEKPLFKKVILSHLPAFISETPKYRNRIKQLPPKIQYAILASEIASNIVYRNGWEENFENKLTSYVKGKF